MKNSKERILNKEQLQLHIKYLAAANNKAKLHRDAIYEHCIQMYGYTPSDVNFDDFIDMVDSSCNFCRAMNVDTFLKRMEELCKI